MSYVKTLGNIVEGRYKGVFKKITKSSSVNSIFSSDKTKNKQGMNFCYSHFSEAYLNSIIIIPDEFYGKIRRIFSYSPERTSSGGRFSKFGNKGPQTMPAGLIEEKYQDRLPCYHLDKIYSSEPGYGTRSIQNLVRTSLSDPRTEGRVTLEVCDINLDNRHCPSAFYYKMGFRFKDPDINQEFETWLNNGGIRKNAPIAYGFMYLPQKNIMHCLNYKPKNISK